MRKSNKSEMGAELKSMIKTCTPRDIHKSGEKSVLVIDFMAFARKIPVEKMHLGTFVDLATILWAMFMKLCGDTCERVDIIFDNYFKRSIKQHERNRRPKSEAIITPITNDDQPLPVDLSAFWTSS